jgi:Flp pilus assembly protein TadG
MNNFFYLDRKKEEGQALVEFALLLPVLLLVVLGIIQFGIIFSGYITVVSAAREGARAAIVGESDANVKLKAIEIVNGSPFLVEIGGGDVTITTPTGKRIQQEPVSVLVTTSVRIIVPIVGSIVGNDFPVTSEAIMRVEYVGASP